MFELLSFIIFDIAFKSYVVSAAITYCLSAFVSLIRHSLARRNLSQKTLIDKRFLIQSKLHIYLCQLAIWEKIISSEFFFVKFCNFFVKKNDMIFNALNLHFRIGLHFVYYKCEVYTQETNPININSFYFSRQKVLYGLYKARAYPFPNPVSKI